jgi:hypothetical protein
MEARTTSNAHAEAVAFENGSTQHEAERSSMDRRAL